MQSWRDVIQSRKIRIGLLGISLCIILGMIFYRSILGSLVLLPSLPFFFKYVDKKIKKKEERELKRQFKDALLSISSGLRAGMSIESAVLRCACTMKQMYGENSAIAGAMQKLDNSIKCNETVEHAFAKLGMETDLQEIKDFAEVLITAKRTGGNLILAITNAATSISMREETGREIETMLAGKQYEARLMNLLPLGILVYLQAGLPSFSEKLYGNVMGIFVMTIALAAYIVAFLWTDKITEEVMKY